MENTTIKYVGRMKGKVVPAMSGEKRIATFFDLLSAAINVGVTARNWFVKKTCGMRQHNNQPHAI